MTKRRTYPRRGIHEEIVHTIGLRIVQGELQPGDPLPTEDELNADHGYSRTVLREAVRVLAAKGLVHAQPKTGTHVRPRSEWNIVDPDVLAWRVEAGPDHELYEQVAEVRIGIEPQAAQLSAARATDEEIEAIQEAYAAMEAGVGDQAAYLAADLLFHDRILGACHNELLGHLGSLLRAVFRSMFTYTNSSPAARCRALPLHRAIVEGIVARDGDVAEAAMRTLIGDTAAAVGRSAKRQRRIDARP